MIMTTTNLNEHKSYKKAKLIVKDLTAIMDILNNTSAALVPYRRYVPIKTILKTLDSEKMLVRMFLKKYTDIMNNKGKIENSDT